MSTLSDSELLVIRALERQLISREQWMAAKAAWVPEGERSLEEILLFQGALRSETSGELRGVVSEYLELSRGQPRGPLESALPVIEPAQTNRSARLSSESNLLHLTMSPMQSELRLSGAAWFGLSARQVTFEAVGGSPCAGLGSQVDDRSSGHGRIR